MLTPIVTTPKNRRFRYALNLGWFFTDRDLSERINLAKQAGFNAVELFWPDRNPLALNKALRDSAMDVAMINMYEGNYAAGDRGFLCYPERSDEWRSKFNTAMQTCSALKCSRLNVLTGNIPAGMTRNQARHNAIKQLEWATPIAQDHGVKLVIEPLNHLTHPHYLCQRTGDVLELIDSLDPSTIGIEYDTYHAQTSEGNLIRTIESHIKNIFHIQLADCPSRKAPGTGEINFANVINRLVTLNYDGFVGLEFTPGGAAQDFGWLPLEERSR